MNAAAALAQLRRERSRDALWFERYGRVVALARGGLLASLLLSGLGLFAIPRSEGAGFSAIGGWGAA